MFRATLASDAAAMKVIFKASGGGKTVVGGSARGAPAVSKASRGGGGHRLPVGHEIYLSMAPSPGPLPFGAGIYTPPGLYTPEGGARAPRPQAWFARGKVPGGFAQSGAGGRGAGGGRGGDHGLPAPPGPLFVQAAAARRDYNAMIQAQ